MPVLYLPALLIGLLGLMVGSFVNVVIARVPEGLSVVTPRSRCPHCSVPIAARDNIPVISWLILGGRGRCCGQPISPRYPLVELATGVSFAGLTLWLLPSRPWSIPAYLYFAAISIALAMIDLAVKRLPYAIVASAYPITLVLLALAAFGPLLDPSAGAAATPQITWSSAGLTLGRAVLAGLALWIFYRVLHQINPSGMGYGDVRLAGVLGLYLGFQGWAEVIVGGFAGFLIGGVGGIAVLVGRRGTLRSHIPFGPFMLLGAWSGLAAGTEIAEWYLRAAGL